jgi:hypothetical protein
MIWLLTSLLFSCADKDGQNTPEDDSNITGSCTEGETVTAVFSFFGYSRNENGVSWGFNLDDHVSEAGDPEGCNKADFVDPLGNEGIDNALSNLLPALESTEAAALEPLLQQSINTGDLLIMIEITGIDDRNNDDCVSVGFYRGKGSPMIGTNGMLLDGQSFERDLSLPYSIVENVSIENGHMTAMPLDIQIPAQILDEALNLHIYNGGLDITLLDDGGLQGFLGGSIPISFLTDIIELDDVNLPEGVSALLYAAADLYPDDEGVCEYLSVAFQYEAIPAFFYIEE